MSIQVNIEKLTQNKCLITFNVGSSKYGETSLKQMSNYF